LTLELLKAVTKDAVPKPKPEYQQKTPTTANEISKYLFLDVQGSEIDESMRLFDDSIVYRDFNNEDPLNGLEEVQGFIEDFSFPGIEFRPDRFDDGIESFAVHGMSAWIMHRRLFIKGISFYEIDPNTPKNCYVRDVPESAIKPPPLGKIARDFRPGLGVFNGVTAGRQLTRWYVAISLNRLVDILYLLLY
jgi:hypothetical protein